MLKVILGSFGAFLIFDNFVSRKQHVLEQNVHLNLYVIQFNVVIVWHPVKRSIKGPGLLVIFMVSFLSLHTAMRNLWWNATTGTTHIITCCFRHVRVLWSCGNLASETNKYSGPHLIGTCLLPTNFVFIREVSFGKREHHKQWRY